METPSSWVSGCQFINLRSKCVSVQVSAGKAGVGWGVGGWGWAHTDFLQSFFSNLLTLASVGDKRAVIVIIFSGRSHTRSSKPEATWWVGSPPREWRQQGGDRAPAQETRHLPLEFWVNVDRSLPPSLCLRDRPPAPAARDCMSISLDMEVVRLEWILMGKSFDTWAEGLQHPPILASKTDWFVKATAMTAPRYRSDNQMVSAQRSDSTEVRQCRGDGQAGSGIYVWRRMKGWGKAHRDVLC